MKTINGHTVLFSTDGNSNIGFSVLDINGFGGLSFLYLKEGIPYFEYVYKGDFRCDNDLIAGFTNLIRQVIADCK